MLHHPHEVLLAQFSLYVHKGGLKLKFSSDDRLLYRPIKTKDDKKLSWRAGHTYRGRNSTHSDILSSEIISDYSCLWFSLVSESVIGKIINDI